MAEPIDPLPDTKLASEARALLAQLKAFAAELNSTTEARLEDGLVAVATIAGDIVEVIVHRSHVPAPGASAAERDTFRNKLQTVLLMATCNAETLARTRLAGEAGQLNLPKHGPFSGGILTLDQLAKQRYATLVQAERTGTDARYVGSGAGGLLTVHASGLGIVDQVSIDKLLYESVYAADIAAHVMNAANRAILAARKAFECTVAEA